MGQNTSKGGGRGMPRASYGYGADSAQDFDPSGYGSPRMGKMSRSAPALNSRGGLLDNRGAYDNLLDSGGNVWRGNDMVQSPGSSPDVLKSSPGDTGGIVPGASSDAGGFNPGVPYTLPPRDVFPEPPPPTNGGAPVGGPGPVMRSDGRLVNFGQINSRGGLLDNRGAYDNLLDSGGNVWRGDGAVMGGPNIETNPNAPQQPQQRRYLPSIRPDNWYDVPGTGRWLRRPRPGDPTRDPGTFTGGPGPNVPGNPSNPGNPTTIGGGPVTGGPDTWGPRPPGTTPTTPAPEVPSSPGEYDLNLVDQSDPQKQRESLDKMMNFYLQNSANPQEAIRRFRARLDQKSYPDPATGMAPLGLNRDGMPGYGQ